MSAQAQLSHNGQAITQVIRRGRKQCRVRLEGSNEPDGVLVPTAEIKGLTPKEVKAKKEKAKANG